MFDGSFKSTRKVNLSGRKKPTAGYKEDLVLQARLAREQRQEHKRRAAASTKLQALFRRVSTARRTRVLVFQQLEVELAQLVAAADIRAEPLPTVQLQRLLRQLLFAVPSQRKRPAVDAAAVAGATPERLMNVQTYVVVMLLVSCLRGSREQGTNMLLAPGKDAAWAYQIARVLELALAQLDVASPAVDSSPYLILLELFTRRGNYSTTEDVAAYAAMMARLAVDARDGTFDALSNLTTRCRRLASDPSSAVSIEELASKNRVVQAVANASAETLSLCLEESSKTLSARRQQQILLTFAHTVMLTPEATASPIIMKHALPNAADDDRSNLWCRILRSFETPDRQHGAELSWRDRAVLVGNTIELIALHQFHPELVRSGVAVIARHISPSLIRWAFDVSDRGDTVAADVALTPSEDDDFLMLDNDNAELHDDLRLQVAAMYLSNTLSDQEDREQREGIASLAQEERAGVRAQWQPLCFSVFCAKSFDILLASGDLHDAQDAGANDRATLDMSHICACVLLSAGRSHVLRVETTFASPTPPVFALLSALSAEDRGASSSNVIHRLWRWIVAHAPAYRSSGGSSSAISATKARFLEALMVFNVVFSQTLLGLDDEAFYDRSWPLPVSEVADVVAFVNRFLFDSCWDNGSSSGSATSSSLVEPTESELALFAAVTSSVKLFNQLYDRDCRRSFAPDGAWLWPSMPAIKETVDFAAMSEDSTTHGAPALFLLLKGWASSSSSSSSSHSRVALVLATLPQVLSFNDRVQLFQKLLGEDKLAVSNMRDEFSRSLKVRVKRDTIVDDSFRFFDEVVGSASTATPLKARIKVTFVNEQGLEEAGIDGGGVFKEFVDQLTKNAFSPEYGFFLATDDEQQLLYPNPAVETFVVDSRREVIDRFRFLGRVLAKAVYENILVEPQFAAFFLNKLLGKFNYIDDLQSLDPALYRSLMSLKHITDERELADLALTFSVTERAFGRVVTRDLVPNGANIPVTNANKIRYMHVLANYKLNVQSSVESAAFLRGFRDLIPAPWIQMFSPAELQMLIGGSATRIDVDDWEKHTMYGGGYHPSQPPIQWFWSLVRDEFSPADRAALLKFVTSCSRQPLLGFGQLSPQICIHQVRVDDDDRLPSSATCMNLLKLPAYSSKDAMRRKLLYAIRANAGFDLS